MDMIDIELIHKVMKFKHWKQIHVAEYLQVNRSKITKVLKYGEKLHPSSRKLLEMLVEQSQ